MKVTQSIKNSLVTSANEEVDATYKTYQAAKKAYDEAINTRSWVTGLVVGDALVPTTAPIVPPVVNFTPPVFTKTARTRYFVASKSGTTKGHYITLFSDATVDCSCPGFVNRGYCWASNKVKTSRYSFPQWNLSKSLFETNRFATFNQ